jgi:hypothetical protein
MNISRIDKAVATLREDQTLADAAQVRHKDVDILLPSELCPSLRLLARIATALLLRCFKGAVRVHDPMPDLDLATQLETEARRAGATERLVLHSLTTGPWRLALGQEVDGAVSADASGWTARVNRAFGVRERAAVPAIAFAAACAVAKLFDYAIRGADRHLFEAWDFCLLRFQAGDQKPLTAEADVHLGRIALLGAGGIGSALGLILALSEWGGELHVIDSDSFEEPNLETCVFADIADVRRPIRKALALANAFQGHRIHATERHCRLKANDPLLKESWDAFLCAVDNLETRLVLDDVNAAILLNAGLGATKADAGWVLWSQHGKGDHRLSTLYRDGERIGPVGSHVPNDFVEECSRMSYLGVSLALPFAGLVAGSLLATSLFRRATGRGVETTLMQLDLLNKQQCVTLLTPRRP